MARRFSHVYRRNRSQSSGDQRIALSFGGSGLMMFYHFGAARQLAQNKKFMERVAVVHGTSGGAICGSMLLACPDRFDDALDFFTTGKWLRNAKPKDILAPHSTLLFRAIKDLDLNTDHSRLRGKFVAHVTKFPGARNVGIDDFESDQDVLNAIAASCCLSPRGWDYKGQTLYDGGFSDPLPSDPDLPTISVSILSGRNIDLCPTVQNSRNNRGPLKLTTTPPDQATPPSKRYLGRPYLRYPVTTSNALALMETVFLTPDRARRRYSQGRRDADLFLENYLSRH